MNTKNNLPEQARPAPILYDFTDGTGGWALTGGTLSANNGHLVATDTKIGQMKLLAPPQLSGDLSAYQGGVFSFDAHELANSSGHWRVFGTLTISSDSATLTAKTGPKLLSSTWTPYSVQLDAASFGVTQTVFDRVMAHVTGFSLNVESGVKITEVVEIDNILLRSTVNNPNLNNAPQGSNNTITVLEDTGYSFKADDFGFSDVKDNDALANVIIASLPATGALQLNGVAVTAGQAVAAADLDNLVFTPAANASGTGNTSFSFKVQDDGGTANGGSDTDLTANTMTFNVTAVNDAPTGTVTIAGTATKGQTLTATNTLADADGLGTISYQWKADGAVISGTHGNTLVLAGAQVGKVITVVAGYTDGQGFNEAVPSDPTAAVTNLAAINLDKTVLVEPSHAIGGSNVGGGINLGHLTDNLFFFANGSQNANWLGATKGFVGDVVIDGIQAKEHTSNIIPFAGTIHTNAATLGTWQGIIDDNAKQAHVETKQTALVSGLENDLNNAFAQINGLTASAGYTGISAASLNGLNTQDGINRTYVINVTSGFTVSSKIDITGDSGDVFVLRWDTDANYTNGYQGQVKFHSGGAIVPLGGLTAGNFIHVAGDINASGGGGNPASPYPQGPHLNEGTGSLISGGSDFSGGGFFTGYWLTTGASGAGGIQSLSNAVFVGGWYTQSDNFAMTSGTGGVHISPNQATLTFDPAKVGTATAAAHIGDALTFTYKVTNTGTVDLTGLNIVDDNAGGTQFTPDSLLVAFNGGSYNYGDLNRNGEFDAGENWYFQHSQTATGSVGEIYQSSATVDAYGAGVHIMDSDSATVQIIGIQS